jgi:hypothetical protein
MQLLTSLMACVPAEEKRCVQACVYIISQLHKHIFITHDVSGTFNVASVTKAEM